ncbi:gamma-glutamylcyclotransferase [Roseovarius sp. CAU 1744]|uniref:gamma-glutamylcyclotransferase n=1 Tax=Roseovarius sp. CAU 1744 TaxID=3140368 RepID=UPI00325A5323
MMSDPFIHHPELRDKITDPSLSFFRDFNAADAFSQQPGLSWVVDMLRTFDQREACRKVTLAEKRNDHLWVFAYGSLMWDPAFDFRQVRRGKIEGFSRRFILKDIYGARGTIDQPGAMAALDTGPGCHGLIFQIDREKLETETEILWRREMAFPCYIPTFVTVTSGGENFEALTFVADHKAGSMHPDLTHDEQVQFLATGKGFLGTSKEYLENIVSHFTALGILDESCVTLLRDVEAFNRSSEAA